jgi:hypothetical protein
MIPYATTSPPPSKSATIVSTLAGERLGRRSRLLAINRARAGHGEAARAILPVWQQDVASLAGSNMLISNRLKPDLHQAVASAWSRQTQRPAAGLSPRAGFNL